MAHKHRGRGVRDARRDHQSRGVPGPLRGFHDAAAGFEGRENGDGAVVRFLAAAERRGAGGGVGDGRVGAARAALADEVGVENQRGVVR